MRSLFVVGLLAITVPAHAQLASALGKPVPSPDLADGTITVLVLDGAIDRPLIGVRITLTVDGQPRYATTTTMARAEFTGVPVGAKVQATYDKVASEVFVVPAKGGTRVLLSTKPLEAGPSPRQIGSIAMADDTMADGTLAVRLTYDDLHDPKPPAGIAVALVGFAADDTITVVTRTTDAQGKVTFDKLDHAGTTAYHAMALLPRDGKTDRLVVPAIVLPAKGGERVTMTGDKRGAKTPPVDELAKLGAQDPLPAGKVRVKLVGASDPKASITIVDATTGKVLAHGAPATDQVDLAVAARAGQVVYAEATSSGHRYRSLPFQPVAHAGSTAVIYAFPRVLVTYAVLAQASDPVLEVSAELDINNNAWAPYQLGDDIPLPRGFIHADLPTDDPIAALTPTGIKLLHPLMPGSNKLHVGFELPAKAGRATWSLDLPLGAWKSRVAVAQEPGVTVTPPPSVSVNVRSLTDGPYYVLGDIDIAPNQAMTFDVTVPALPPIERACRKMSPDRGNALDGKPMPSFSAAGLDGKKLDLAALKGKVTLVTFISSWVFIGKPEPATIEALVKAVPGVAAVLIYSDGDPKEVRPLVDAKAGYRVLLDPPIGDSNIGPITVAWGTHALPESYLIDRKGIVRYYFANQRDWSKPEAIACVRALSAGSP